MNALSLSYQAERPNVEANDLTVLVIRALGLIVGRMVREDSDISDISTISDIRSRRRFIPTALITGAAQQIAEVHEVDINIDQITSKRIANSLQKMRFTTQRQANGGKRGWSITLEEVIRWADSYGLDVRKITGISEIQTSLHNTNVTNGTNVTNVTVGDQGRSDTPIQWTGAL